MRAAGGPEAIAQSALLVLLRDPSAAPTLSLADWDVVVRQARATYLLPRLAAALSGAGLLEAVPTGPRRHFQWTLPLIEKHRRDVGWEVAHVRNALAQTPAPVILLKGAAYMMAGLPVAAGRIFADLDILAPLRLLPIVEKSLISHGWMVDGVSAYDERYYRTWMHELPPMRHMGRGTVLDVHHTILPRTSRARIDADRIIAAARPIADGSLFVLAPEDMALHAVVHSFHDGDFSHGLRELVDVDALLRGFGDRPDFWPRLLARAEEFGVARALWYALRCSRRFLETPVPEDVTRALRRYAPNPLIQAAMDAVLLRALTPSHPSCEGANVRMSRFALYIRSHYLRMPLRLLLPHLARKAAMGMTAAKKRPA